MKGKINNKGPTDRRGTKVFAIGLMVVMLTNFLGACKLTEKAPKYTLNPTEPAVTETTVMETTAETTTAVTETTATTEETKPSETEPSTTSETSEEPTITETTAAKKAVTPTKAVTTTSKPTTTPKATTKKTTKKKSSGKKSSGSGKIKDGDDDDDDDDEKPAKKKPTNTPTPKPYTYCTCDAKINYGWDGSSNKGTHTLKGLTARKTKSGTWVLTDASDDKVVAWLNKNVTDENGKPNWGRYSDKVTNKRDYRYKP